MSTLSSVWVFSDSDARLAELTGGALNYGATVNVFTLNAGQSALAFRLGAGQVYQLDGKPDDRMVEDYADTMVAAIRESGPGLVMLPATRRGKLLAARIGARLGAAVSNDISDLSVNEGQVVTRHMVYGGLAVGEESVSSPFCVVTVSGGVFEPAAESEGRTGTPVVLAWQAPAQAVIRTATQRRESQTVNIDKARLVVSVGRGIGGPQNLPMAQALCSAIGAELACSRPVAENEKWMPHERYVGISNLIIKPELYLAVGISGQIQHMVGANGAQTIVAINKDKNAPIFQYADYGIVGDLQRILPVLTGLLAH